MPAPTPPSTNIRVLPASGDTDNNLLRKMLQILSAGLGVGGSDWVSAGTNYVGDWWVFHAVSDSVIASVTYKPGTVGGSGAGQTIKAGDRIYGNIIGLSLTSGSGELYRAIL